MRFLTESRVYKLYGCAETLALVKDLSTLNLPAAASFKHVSPAGAALVYHFRCLKKAYFADGVELSPWPVLMCGQEAPTGCPPFGDWAALSDVVDVSTASVLRKKCRWSDCPGYTDEALEILRKEGGKYNIIKIDPAYEADEIERGLYSASSLYRRKTAMCRVLTT